MARIRRRWPRRGEVYLLDFGKPRGHEMAGVHPCIVMQNDTGNQYAGTIIVVAITRNLRVAALPIGVRVAAGSAGLDKDSAVNCSHVYTIDKTRLGRRIGSFGPPVMAKVDKALAISLGLPVTS